MAVPYTFANNTTADADQVNANFNELDTRIPTPASSGLLARSDASGNVVWGTADETIPDGSIQQDKMATGANGLAVGAFNVYRGAVQSAASGDIVSFADELFDVSGWFDTATGRYTPLVAGYYRLSWRVGAAAALADDVFWNSGLRKGGGQVALGQPAFQRGTATTLGSVGSTVVQANGSSEYFDVVVWHGVGAASNIAAGADVTFFCGELIGRS